MRDQIIQALNDAANTGLLNDATSPNLSGDERSATIAIIAEGILARLSEVPQGTPQPRVEVLPAPTPVLTMDPAQVVAALASASIRQDDAAYADDVENGALSDPDSGISVEQPYRIVHQSMPAGEDRRAFREFLFAIQKQFGVRVRSIARTGSTGEPVFVVAGRENAVRGFILLAQTFHDLGFTRANDLPEDERAAFWATIGTLVNSTDRALDQADSNQPLYEAATGYLNSTFGLARNLNRAEASEPGTDAYDDAVRVLADAATRL